MKTMKLRKEYVFISKSGRLYVFWLKKKGGEKYLCARRADMFETMGFNLPFPYSEVVGDSEFNYNHGIKSFVEDLTCLGEL